MTPESARMPSPPEDRTIILSIGQEEYTQIVGEKVWGVYYSATRRMMSQRIRRLSDWAKKNLSGIVLAKTLDLCDKKAEWSLWYKDESAYTTSNALDRLMRCQNRYFERGQHFHGSLASANLRSRAWAVLYNRYWEWGVKNAGGK